MGQGPEDYLPRGQIIYDEESDEVYVRQIISNIIKVYSSAGDYKRKLTLPEGTMLNAFVSFDEESLFVFDEVERLKKSQPDLMNFSDEHLDYCFARISKKDGTVLDYAEIKSSHITLRDDRNIGEMSGIVGRTSRIIKCKEGVLLCHPETDTVFLYSKDKILTPVIYKTPLVSEMDPMIYMNNCIDVGNYQFMELFTVRWEEGAFPFPVKYLMRDKTTGDVFRQKIIIPDYKGKEIVFSPLQSGRDYENGPYFELDLFELKQAYDENRLSGKLKDLVASLDELEDNNVFMIVNFNAEKQ
jgi:hypothetical protein